MIFYLNFYQQRHHIQEYELYQKTKDLKEAIQTQQQILTPVIQVDPYARSDPRQKRFEKDLLHFVIKDTTPFSLVEGVGFRNLIHGLDKRLIIPRRFTIERWVANESVKVNGESLYTNSRDCYTSIDFYRIKNGFFLN